MEIQLMTTLRRYLLVLAALGLAAQGCEDYPIVLRSTPFSSAGAGGAAEPPPDEEELPTLDTGDTSGDEPSDVVRRPVTGCGDGVLDDGEECDDGNTDDGDGCSSDCEEEEGFNCAVPGADCEECGNGVQESSEECDDGNAESDDGCSSECRLEEGSAS